MDKETKALCDEMCALMGHKSWTKVGSPCTGKWAGTTDYSLRWEDGQEMFVNNGMYGFKSRLTEAVEGLKRCRSAEHQRAVMEVLREWQASDARLSQEHGVKGYDILGFVEEDGGSCGQIWWGLRLKVGDRVFDHIETGLWLYMSESADAVRKDMESKKGVPVWTAGAVQEVDYIFHGVGFNSQDELYKGSDYCQRKFYPLPAAA